MRVLVKAVLGVADTDLLERFDRPLVRLGLVGAPVEHNRFGDLAPDRVDRRE
jgi:hypothetical protein